MKSLLIIIWCLLSVPAIAQDNWKLISSTNPETTSVSHRGHFHTISILETWKTVETGTLNSVTMKREITHRRTTRYNKGGEVEVKLDMVKIKYFHSKDDGKIELKCDSPNYVDNFYYRGSYMPLPTFKVDGDTISDKNPVQYFDSFASDDHSRAEKRKIIFETLNDRNPYKIGFVLSIGYTPSFAFRTINTRLLQPSYAREFNSRDATETSAFGESVELNLGASIGYRHSILASYIHLRQGLQSNGASISFADGLPYGTVANRTYSFGYQGVGLGYRYSGVANNFNPIAEFGGYYVWKSYARVLQNLAGTQPVDLSRDITGRAENAFGLKVGLGINFRPRYRCEGFFMPTLYYNLTPLYSGAINTHLYNVGLTAGMTYYFIHVKKD